MAVNGPPSSRTRLPNWSDSDSGFNPNAWSNTSTFAEPDGQNGAPTGVTSSCKPRRLLYRSARCTNMLGLACVFFVVFVLYYYSMANDPLPGSIAGGIVTKDLFETIHVPSYADDPGGKRRLRVVMPADGPALNLCKVIMSAVALGYPMPTILNWRGEFNRPDWQFAGSHIAKLESLLVIIETLLGQEPEDADEEDLILLVDAYDIWFQLPPSVLIERFHQLNREADERNRREWEALAADFPVPPPKQSIIVTTAKDCHPSWDSGSEPNYAHWPESPLPSDLYGEDTDRVFFFADPARKHRKVRPRCVNSGLIMGTMGSLRQALRRCKEKVDETAMRGRQLWSDQALIGEVMGDQMLWREWMRSLAATWNGTAAEARLDALAPETRAIAQAAVRDGKKKQFEFGIGLDYNFTTIPPTCSAEEDGHFVVIGDEKALARASARAGVPDGVRVRGIPPELKDSKGPVPGKKWDEVPLYTDFYFGLSPVGIHHNAYINGLKPWRLENWWNMTWFYPHLRDLVVEHLKPVAVKEQEQGQGQGQGQGQTPLARLPPLGKHGKETVYYAPRADAEKKTVRIFEPSREFTPVDWDGVCQKGNQPWHKKIFGDDKGPLEL
ncbi:hypothetical protein SODALDRAFT_142057 [Sodiomyces alkalinus F11]|uniref:Uncharacterized protein n=1 Tax=Sodiomyces alkalinus (strain CBS 110278 / VKM F-3762 / F11) TaxID=1314773 RepID=A0A3N2Q006_SODAK|nr:hypothetical protein SODALDRAFT_142057 [Sodiomyces alkalinus F11]ROT39945.1 hypothetical protein SODALDRAFT_142057 [Sodiomyces alkalinus F11]